MAAVFDTVTLASVDDFHQMPDVPTAYEIKLPNCQLDLYISPKPDSGKTYVFSPGFMARSTFTLPFFQRLRWAEALDATVIILSDPTLRLDPSLGITWFQGTHDHFYLEEVAAALQKMFERLGIPPRRVIFFGSSAGGFSSLMFATRLEGTHAVVNNPQTSILRFNIKPEIKRLLQLNFNAISEDEAEAVYGNRFTVSTYMKNVGNFPNILYVQNMADKHHYDEHMLPFMEETRYIRRSSTQLILVNYREDEARHNPAVFNRIAPYLSVAESLFLK